MLQVCYCGDYSVRDLYRGSIREDHDLLRRFFGSFASLTRHNCPWKIQNSTGKQRNCDLKEKNYSYERSKLKTFKKLLSKIYPLWILLPSSPLNIKHFHHCVIAELFLRFLNVALPTSFGQYIYQIIREHSLFFSDRWNVSIGVQKAPTVSVVYRIIWQYYTHWWSASSHLSSSLHLWLCQR